MIIIDDPQGHREIAAVDGRATLDAGAPPCGDPMPSRSRILPIARPSPTVRRAVSPSRKPTA